MHRGAWLATVHEVAELDMTEQLSKQKARISWYICLFFFPFNDAIELGRVENTDIIVLRSCLQQRKGIINK